MEADCSDIVLQPLTVFVAVPAVAFYVFGLEGEVLKPCWIQGDTRGGDFLSFSVTAMHRRCPIPMYLLLKLWSKLGRAGTIYLKNR